MLMGLVTAPLRAAAASTRMVVNASASIALIAADNTLLAGSDVAASVGRVVGNSVSDLSALTHTAVGMAVEAVGGPPIRRVSANGPRRWIEVRGLDSANGAAVGTAVLTALRDAPGVRDAVLNTAASRIVVTIDSKEADSPELCTIVAEAERSVAQSVGRPRSTNLPGDDAVFVARVAAAAVAAAGVGLAVTGSMLHLPGLPSAIAVPVALFDQTPRLRGEIERRLGIDGTELLFAAFNSAAAALTASPSAAVAEAASRTMLAAEAWNVRRAWQRHEPELAGHSAPGGAGRIRVDKTESVGSADRYANRAGMVGIGAAATLAAMTRDANFAGVGALVAAPKPLRASREALGCALSRGLNNRHDALVLAPRALRMLDRIDAIVIDPRVLYIEELMISRVRGVENSHRAPAWEAARVALDAGRLTAGWHPLSTIPNAGDAGEALVSPVRDPYASAVLAEARRAKLRVVSVEDDGLRSLAQGFDELHAVDGPIDDALARAVDELRANGATVVLVTSSRMHRAHAADIAIGVRHTDHPPPWGADVFVSDLTGVWRVLRALPVSRRVSDKAIQLSASSSVIGALMSVPGVAGNGPAAVNAGAAAGLWNGFAAGARVFRDELPHPEPGHDWHSLPATEASRLLPRPQDGRHPQPHENGAIRSRAQRLGGTTASSWRTVLDFIAEVRADLDDPLTPLLATGAVASALLGSPVDAALVGSVLVANVAVSAEQQLHAERILRRLLAIQEPLARRYVGLIHDHHHEQVPGDQLRPGDIIEVRGGEIIPADARVLQATNIEVDESALTGESLPITKNADPAPGAPLAERTCMLYGGTTMVAGTGVAVVTGIGAGMEMRRAMAMAPRKSREVGLHAQLQHITKRALPVSVAGGALVGLVGTLRGTPLRRSLAEAVSVIVAAVPEGLPLVATLAQLAAARKLTDKAVLVRNPHSVEAFARLDVVCFDKTGTLSENRLAVGSVRPLSGATEAEVLATAARTTFARPGHRAEHATDEAIRIAAEAASVRHFDEREAFLPFQSDRPFAASLRGAVIAVKGSPEMISATLAAEHDAFTRRVEEMSAAGLRVLGVAARRINPEQAAAAASDPAVLEELCRSGLAPVGLLGLADTLRASAKPLLAELDHRGIGVRLITGDHPVTAKAVAAELGLAVDDVDVITGSEWKALSAQDRAEAVTTRRVFARMTPEHKIDIVQTLERAGVVTAMVGDGANDAAAIRAATVGIGVVARGSDPARTAADVMLLDGRIEAVLDAIDESHQLWRRVHSAVSVLLGGNLGEICFALITTLLTGDSALNTRQMLLVNLLTDALPAAALAVSDQSRSGAVYHDEAALWREIAVRGAATTGAATLAWLLARPTGTASHAATVALIGLVSAQLMQTLVDSNSPAVVLTSLGSMAVMGGVISMPGISHLFGCTPVGPIGWGQGLFAATAATALSVSAPGLLTRVVDAVEDHLPGRHAVHEQPTEFEATCGSAPASASTCGEGGGGRERRET